jgi:hypothetical protein
MQPPRLTVIAHGKLSSYVVTIQLASGPRPPPCRTVQPRSTLPSRSGCFPNSGRCLMPSLPLAKHECLAFRNSTQLHRCPYCYRLPSDNRLESVANAHTAADLHVRPVSKTALVSRSWALRATQQKHDARFLAIRLVTGALRLSGTVALLRRSARKASF